MKREIKFRAWIPCPRGNLSPHMLELVDIEQGRAKFGHTYFDDDIVMQFTGLTDKNGTEIYEGDILDSRKWNTFKKERTPSVVFWMESHGMFQHRWNEGSGFNDTNEFWVNEPLWKILLLGEPHKAEIIGNIYENPELLDAE